MRSKLFVWSVLGIEALMILLFGIFVRVEDSASIETVGSSSGLDSATAQLQLYPFFQDINVMIFVGFAFNMAFLKYHTWNSISLNFLVGAIGVQLYIVFNGFWQAAIQNDWSNPIELSLRKLIAGEYCVATILISFGAVLGKVNAMQMLVMTFIESFVYAFTEVIVVQQIKVVDYGGSFVVHAFGAYFGVMVSYIASPENTKDNLNNDTSYKSMVFASIGTMFLWMFWPSANSAFAKNPQEQHLSIINTFLALSASTLTTFSISCLFNDGKFKMQDVMNACLAGGVLIGSSCNFIVYPAISILIGAVAGMMTTFGLERSNEYMTVKYNLYDTCGVQYLHGIPGILGALISAAIIVTRDYTIYELNERKFGIDYSFSEQAGYQILGMLICVVVPAVFGTLTGYIIRKPVFFNEEDDIFVDGPYWVGAKISEHSRSYDLTKGGASSIRSQI